MSDYEFTTRTRVRNAFWRSLMSVDCPTFRAVKGTKHSARTRAQFAEFVYELERDGLISSELAQEVTL